jgi:hypothetical protein
LCFSLETHEQSNKIGLVKEISTRGDGTSLIVFNYLTNEQDDIVRELLNNNWMKQSDNLKEKLSIYFSEIDGKISTVSTFWRDKLDVPEERDVAAICRTIYE